MKRYVVKPDYKLTISINFGYEISTIAADTLVSHPKQLAKRDWMDDDSLMLYDDAIQNVVNTIERYFTILRKKQSKKSYAYYILFDSGNVKDSVIVEVQFRISDHPMKGSHKENATLTSENDDRILRIKSFDIGTNKYPSTNAVLIAVDKICKRIQEGDFDCLDKL